MSDQRVQRIATAPPEPTPAPAATPDLKVDQPIAAYQVMAAHWRLTRALRAGTDAMRLEAQTFLPKEPRESDGAYQVRLGRSFLFGAYDDTVRTLARRPFSKPIELGKEADARLAPLVTDVDLEGRDLTTFAQEVFDHAVDDGLCHILVDHPPAAEGETLEDERKAGRRPFFCLVPARAVIGWRAERFRGRLVLTQLRILEEETKPAGPFGEALEQRVRVFDRVLPTDVAPGSTTWRLFVRDAKSGEYRETATGTVSVNEIPLRTVYTNRLDVMVARPPLWSLAEKNLEHWQSSSDQRNLLRFIRTGILFGAGITASDLGLGKTDADTDDRPVLEIGANRMLVASDAQASLQWVEHTGQAQGAGRQDLVDLKDEMRLLGLRPLVERKTMASATEAVIEEARETSDLQAWSEALRLTLQQAFALALAFIEPGSLEEVPVTMVGDMGLPGGTANDGGTLIQLRAAGDITRETLLRELQRRGVLDPSLDIEQEIESLGLEVEDDLAGDGSTDPDDEDRDDTGDPSGEGGAGGE